MKVFIAAVAVTLLTAGTDKAATPSPQQHPGQQLPAPSKLVPVTPQTLERVRAQFNAGAAGPRALVFLSAGCAACEPAAEALQEIVRSHKGPLTVFVVWDAVLSDGPPPGPKVQGLLTDARIHQLWDASHTLSDAMKKVVVDAQGKPLAQGRLRTENSEAGILYDTVVLFPKDARWERTLPAPVFFDGGFEAVKKDVQQRLAALAAPPR